MGTMAHHLGQREDPTPRQVVVACAAETAGARPRLVTGPDGKTGGPIGPDRISADRQIRGSSLQLAGRRIAISLELVTRIAAAKLGAEA